MAPARALIGAVLCGGALLAGGPAPAAHAAAPPPLSVVQDDAALLREGPALRDATLDDMASLGADVVRIIVTSGSVPAAWPQLDAAVAGARARGLRPLLTLVGPARSPDVDAYAAFVAQAGARYRDVHLWSVWNEPNIPTWLTPQATAPHRYRLLADAAVRALHRTGHAKDTILVGETAPAHTARGGPTSPLAFVRAVLRDGPIAGTGWAHHGYSAGGVGDPGLPGPKALLWPARIGALQAALRGRHLPVWITEAGFQTDPPDRDFGIPLTLQAAWMNEDDAILTRAGVRSVAQYLVRDEPRISSFQSGVRFADGTAKPSFAAYQAPLWVTRHGRSRSVAVYARVRPRGARLVALQRFARGGWREVLALSGRTLDRRVTAPAAAAGAWRVRWRDATGALHGSRVAAEAPR